MNIEPTGLARQPGFACAQLTSDQLARSRGLLTEALAGHRSQLEGNEALATSLTVDTDDDACRDREIARLAADSARDAIADAELALGRPRRLETGRDMRRRGRSDPHSGVSERSAAVVAASRACHPSAARTGSNDLERCARCGYVAAGPATAGRAVADVVEVGQRLLRATPTDRNRQAQPTPGVLARVARVRDELHAVANRAERFRLTDRPSIHRVRVHAATATTTMLSPGQVLHQLNLVAARLVEVLDALVPPDWHRVADVDDLTLTLGPLVDDVLHPAYHDLLDLVGEEGRGV